MKIISRITEEIFWHEFKKQMSYNLRFQELQTNYKNWAKAFFNVKLDKNDINNLVVSDDRKVYEPIIECFGLSRGDFENHRTIGYIACLISKDDDHCLKNKEWFSYLDKLTNSDFTLFIRTLHRKESKIGKYFIEDGTHRLLSKLIFGDKLNADNLKCYMASNKCNFYYKLHRV